MTTSTDTIPVVRAFTIFGTQVRTQRPTQTTTRVNLDAGRDREERERRWERDLRLMSAIGMR